MMIATLHQQPIVSSINSVTSFRVTRCLELIAVERMRVCVTWKSDALRWADESRLPAPGDWWLKKIFGWEGHGVEEDSYQRLGGTNAAILRSDGRTEPACNGLSWELIGLSVICTRFWGDTVTYYNRVRFLDKAVELNCYSTRVVKSSRSLAWGFVLIGSDWDNNSLNITFTFYIHCITVFLLVLSLTV